MKKPLLLLGVFVVAAAVLGAYTFIKHGESTIPTEEAGTGNAAVGASGASSVVTYTDSGFSPTPLTIAVGTTVTWVNKSSHKMWVEGSGSSCVDKDTFNECVGVSADGSYSFTFTKVGTASYVNHERSGDVGSIVVTEAAVSGPINPNAVPQ